MSGARRVADVARNSGSDLRGRSEQVLRPDNWRVMIEGVTFRPQLSAEGVRISLGVIQFEQLFHFSLE